ncbi:MAG: FKBP-type peptidyl-prolyl cis-trans isomerase [Phycisphaerales bacterium]|nr:MAG: FKBP-type peptidyl-prolyl cis-trans isomerase [Phycisphaerales bacterium]
MPDMRSRASLSALVLATVALVGCSERDVKVKETPLRVLSETVGHGREAQPGDIVTIDYRVLLPDGRELLSQKDFSFQLGAGVVVEGMDQAVDGMRVGGKRTVKCPPHKHWGSAGYGDGKISPNTHLTFSVRLTAVD